MNRIFFFWSVLKLQTRLCLVSNSKLSFKIYFIFTSNYLYLVLPLYTLNVPLFRLTVPLCRTNASLFIFKVSLSSDANIPLSSLNIPLCYSKISLLYEGGLI